MAAIKRLRQFAQGRKWQGTDAELRADLRELIEISDNRARLLWRPISTAPQDGDEILVSRICGVRVQWMHFARRHRDDPGTSWKINGGACLPTHWLDVPRSLQAE